MQTFGLIAILVLLAVFLACFVRMAKQMADAVK